MGEVMQFPTKCFIWMGGVEKTQVLALPNFWIVPCLMKNSVIVMKIPLYIICIEMSP